MSGPIALISLKDVQAEDVPWLWCGWIARGCLTFVVGEPGVGKSSMSWDLAARLSVGGPWPTGERMQPGRTLLISGEDSLTNWMTPRLRTYGADMDRIMSMDPSVDRRLRLDKDCCHLEQVVRENGIDLVVIDPFDAFLGEVNPNIASEVRSITNGLADMAQRSGCAVAILHHFNKNQGASHGNRVAGSIDIIGAARTVLYVVKDISDPQSRVVFIQKSNLGQMSRPMVFSTDQDERLVWCEAPEGFEPGRALSANTDGVVEEAIEFLKTVMTEHDGEVRSSIVLDQARDAGISKNALDKAKARLGIRSRKVGGRNGYWVFAMKADTEAA